VYFTAAHVKINPAQSLDARKSFYNVFHFKDIFTIRHTPASVVLLLKKAAAIKPVFAAAPKKEIT
jgi:hypothetical protein